MQKHPFIIFLSLITAAAAIYSCGGDSGTGPASKIHPPPDSLAPYPINDLTITAASQNSARLEWTATGDDGYLGAASAYDIRYATYPITSSNWGSCSQVQNPPTPSDRGELDSVTVTGLSPHTLYDFGLKVADERPNWSDLSNVARAWTGSSSPYQVTNSTESEFNPEWSPDGRWFAFESGNRDIWILPSGGGAPVQLTSNPAWDGSPSWSPDGTRIAFMSNRSGNEDIWIVTVEGGALEQLTTHSGLDTDPAWSPDGGSLAFTSNRSGRNDIWQIPATGGAAVQITNDPSFSAYSACWSPDGSQLAFARNYDIWVGPAGGGAATKLTNLAGTGWGDDPAWSPDGSTIAFSYSAYGGDYNIWLVPAGGGAAVQLTTDPGGDHEPGWRPDSGRVSFRSYRFGQRDIWTIAVP